MDSFSLLEISRILAVVAGMLSILFTTASAIRQYYLRKKKLETSEETEFTEVINSDDIEKFGAYLDDVLGNFTVYEYSSDSSISGRVDSYIEKIQEYVGTVEEVSKEEKPDDYEEVSTIDIPELDEKFNKIIQELQTGERWNALARLRRYIELKLRDIAKDRQIDIKRAYSAGQLLNLLHQRKIVDDKVYKDLKYPIFVSNKAIHGEDINIGSAEEAIYVAARALKYLNTL